MTPNAYDAWYTTPRGRWVGEIEYARWHAQREVLDFFGGLPVRNLIVRSAIFLPSASGAARLMERVIPGTTKWGGMLFVAGEKA